MDWYEPTKAALENFYHRIDMDWYEPTKAALENFICRIEPGGFSDNRRLRSPQRCVKQPMNSLRKIILILTLGT